MNTVLFVGKSDEEKVFRKDLKNEFGTDCRQTHRYWIQNKGFPKPRYITPRLAYWYVGELREWAASQIITQDKVI